MPSFAADVKNELAHKLDKKLCCQTAELAALLRMGASMTLGPNMTARGAITIGSATDGKAGNAG